MLAHREKLLVELRDLASSTGERTGALQKIADLLRAADNYRWVGLYDVDHTAGIVSNIVWSGPGEPEYPKFPMSKGLTGAAISARTTINVGDVASDSRYLTAFGTTRSEIIVPVFDAAGATVVGTIDVESERTNAFNSEVQTFLEACSEAIRSLWTR